MQPQHSSSRNLLGAFCGGALALLTFGYLVPIARLLSYLSLPIICFIGVVLGFWHQEFAHLLSQAWQSCRILIAKSWHPVRFPTMRSPFPGARKFFRQQLQPSVAALWNGTVWFIRRPVATRRWFSAHPMNRALIAQVTTLVVFIVIQAALVVMCFNSSISGVYSFGLAIVGFGTLITIMYGCISLATYGIPINRERQPSMFGLRQYYQDFAYYVDHGWLDFMCRYFGKLLFTQLGFTARLLSPYVITIGPGLLMGILIILPISLGVGFSKAFYKLARRTDHVLCFAVTLVTTIASAVLIEPYLPNAPLLWGSALATGVIAGLLVEAVQRMLVRFMQVNQRLQIFVSVPLKTRIIPAWKLYLGIRQQLDDYIQPRITALAPWLPDFSA